MSHYPERPHEKTTILVRCLSRQNIISSIYVNHKLPDTPLLKSLPFPVTVMPNDPPASLFHVSVSHKTHFWHLHSPYLHLHVHSHHKPLVISINLSKIPNGYCMNWLPSLFCLDIRFHKHLSSPVQRLLFCILQFFLWESTTACHKDD